MDRSFKEALRLCNRGESWREWGKEEKKERGREEE